MTRRRRRTRLTARIGYAVSVALGAAGLAIMGADLGPPAEVGAVIFGVAAIMGFITRWLTTKPTPRQRAAEQRRRARLPRCPRCRALAEWRLMPGGSGTSRIWHCRTCGAKLRGRISGGLVRAGHILLIVLFVANWIMPFPARYKVPGFALAVAVVIGYAQSRKIRLVDDGQYCPHCGYDRAGNTSGTCSECGQGLPVLNAAISRSMLAPSPSPPPPAGPQDCGASGPSGPI